MGKESFEKKEATKANEESKVEKASDATTTTTSATTMEEEPDMPEDIRAYKEKLERETGKKYKYRAPKKDLPSINHMLAHGAPGDENRPRTWLELIGYPILLVLLFCLSFSIFWWINPIENSKYKRGRFSLPKRNKPPVTAGGATGNIPEKTEDL